MWLRKILIAAAVAAPLAFSPIQASAQQGRGAEAREQAHAHGGQTVTQLPPGIAQRVEQGGTVPPGIARRYTPPAPEAAPAPEPAPEPEPTPEPDPTCGWGPPTVQNGIPGTVNSCTGEFIAF